MASGRGRLSLIPSRIDSDFRRLIKRHMRMLRPIRTLSAAGSGKLREVLSNLEPGVESYMGINLNEFLSRLDVFFAPFRFDPVPSPMRRTYLQPPTPKSGNSRISPLLRRRHTSQLNRGIV